MKQVTANKRIRYNSDLFDAVIRKEREGVESDSHQQAGNIYDIPKFVNDGPALLVANYRLMLDKYVNTFQIAAVKL